MGTVADLITAVRQRADMEDTQFVSDTEILGLLSQASGELYNKIVQADEAYFVVPVTFTVSAELYTPAVEFYKVVAIDYVFNGRTKTMRKFNFADRNKLKSSNFSPWYSAYKFCVQGKDIRFMPVPTGITCTLYYIPYAPALTIGGTFDAPMDQWDEFVINSVAAVCVAKEQGDPSFWKRSADVSMAMMLSTIPNRVQSEPDTVIDIYGQNYSDFGDSDERY